MAEKLVDMKRPKRSNKNSPEVCSSDEQYSYGLGLHLDRDELKKLGIDDLPDVGAEMRVVAIGVVESASQRQTRRGKDRDLRIQLQRMSVKPVTKANAVDAVSKAIKDV